MHGPGFAATMREEEALGPLETLGLTRKEARAYLTLVRSGVSTAQQVSELLSVQYPAVYRILHALEQKGWIEVSHERPNRYKARNPKVVAEEARLRRSEVIDEASQRTATLAEAYTTRTRSSEGDLWIYKGFDGVATKLREVVLAAEERVLVVSPQPVDRDILRMVFAALAKGRRPARVILNEGNHADLPRLRDLVRGHLSVEARMPATHTADTRVAHTFVFPSDKELFIVNSFYRDGLLVRDKLQGLWISDMDYVRIQLEAMVKSLDVPTPTAPRRSRPARRSPRTR